MAGWTGAGAAAAPMTPGGTWPFRCGCCGGPDGDAVRAPGHLTRAARTARGMRGRGAGPIVGMTGVAGIVHGRVWRLAASCGTSDDGR